MTEDCQEVCDALLHALPELPIFPLGSTVFFPNTLLPLHIFEPRYRQMTEHAIEGHGIIAVVQSTPDEKIKDVAGVGRIVHHERLWDGRFHILLQGLARVRIIEELPMDGLLYRRARAELLSDQDDGEEAVTGELDSLRACYEQLVHVAPDARDTLGDLPRRIQDAGVLADVVCAAALTCPERRQSALEEPRVPHRLHLATEALADMLLKHSPEQDLLH